MLACLPRDVMSAHCYRLNYIHCFIQPLFGGRLLFLDRPQVGKPTWGYDYTTALRRLPSPSDCHHHRKNRPTSACANGTVHRHPKNRRSAVIYVSTGLAGLPRDTDAHIATAEERLYKHTTRRMHSRQRRVTPNNPIRTTRTAKGAWGIVPLWVCASKMRYYP